MMLYAQQACRHCTTGDGFDQPLPGVMLPVDGWRRQEWLHIFAGIAVEHYQVGGQSQAACQGYTAVELVVILVGLTTGSGRLLREFLDVTTVQGRGNLQGGGQGQAVAWTCIWKGCWSHWWGRLDQIDCTVDPLARIV